MSENKEKQPKHSPLCMSIYGELLNHVGADKAVSMNDLAAHFNVTPRCVRHFLSEIRMSADLEKVVLSNNDGYFIPRDKSELRRYSKRLYRHAFSALKAARSNDAKAAKDGQGVMSDKIIEDFTRFLEAYGESD